MWSLRRKQDGSFYLTFDRERRFTFNLPGRWEWIGSQGATPEGIAHVNRAVKLNRRAGYLVCPDDEGGVRALVLEHV